MRRHTKMLAIAAATAALAAGGLTVAAPAQAATYGCTPMSGGNQYLAPWWDYNDYVVSQGGSFGSTSTSWALSNAGVNKSYNSPWNVSGDAQYGALQLGSYGQASSPQMCVKWQDDRIRFFYKAPYGMSFRVSTTGTSSWGSYTVSTWVTSNSNGWQLSPAIVIPDNTDYSDTQNLKITIYNPNYSSMLVDDVLVDPWKYSGW